jgi:hypothetical protein
MKPRYYVQQTGNAWLVLDRLKIKMHNDVVVSLPTRKAARHKAKELNDEERQDRRADEELTVDGELI